MKRMLVFESPASLRLASCSRMSISRSGAYSMKSTVPVTTAAVRAVSSEAIVISMPSR